MGTEGSGKKKKKAKHSLTNGQEPGLEFTDPAEQPFCGPFSCTLVQKHTVTFRAFVPALFELEEFRF